MINRNVYRGWCEAKGVMYSPQEMGADQLTLSVDGRGFINVHGGSEKLSAFYDHILPLQFTGKYSSKSERIFDGDIIKNLHGETEEERAPFVVEWNESFNGWNLFAGNEYEVLGNRYQNPELIPA